MKFAAAIFLLISIIPFGVCSATLASVWLEASCDGQTVSGTLHVSVADWSEYPHEDFVSLVIQRNTLGICDSWHVITCDPYPIPETQPCCFDTTFNFIDSVPRQNCYYYYMVVAVDSDGVHHSFTTGDLERYQYLHVPCGEAIAMRGELVIGGFISDPDLVELVIEPCPGTCWEGGSLGNFDIYFAAQEFFPFLGMPVNVFGGFADAPYTIWPGFFVDRIEPTSDGMCTQLPITRMSWGALKRVFH